MTKPGLRCVTPSTVWYIFTGARECQVSTIRFAIVPIYGREAALFPFHLIHLQGGNVGILGTSYSRVHYGFLNNVTIRAGHIAGVVYK